MLGILLSESSWLSLMADTYAFSAGNHQTDGSLRWQGMLLSSLNSSVRTKASVKGSDVTITSSEAVMHCFLKNSGMQSHNLEAINSREVQALT